jgi:hypothetical protein
VTEAELGAVRLRVLQGARPIAEHRTNLRVLAHNEWPGSAAPTALLSAFVLPNHPVVTVLLQSVREELHKASLPDALDGYQTGNPARARELTEALYRALQALGIGYVGLPASFEQTGQKIRLPDAVLGDRLGCCLDLSVLFAAALEQMGLAPLLFLVKGHAFTGVWLRDERFPEGVVEDAARVRTLIQLGQILPIEATAVALADQPPSMSPPDSAWSGSSTMRASLCARRPRRAHRVPTPPDPDGAARRVRGPRLRRGGGSHALAVKVLARAAAVPRLRVLPPSPPPTDVSQRFRRWKSGCWT